MMEIKLLNFIGDSDCVRIYIERNGKLSKNFINYDARYFKDEIKKIDRRRKHK